MPMKTTKPKKDNRTERLYIRISEIEKKKIQNKASKCNMNISDYIRFTILSNVSTQDSNTNLPEMIVALQNSYNIIEEYCGKYPRLEKELEKLWENLS